MQIANIFKPGPMPRPNISVSNTMDRLIFVVIFLLVIIMAARMPIDGDMWWHLRAGEESLKLSEPLVTDLFSYTRFGQPWVNHSWLSEIGMYLSFHLLGYLGIGLAVALLAAGGMVFVYLQMQGVPSILRAFVIVLASLVSAPVWTPRPLLPSLVILSLVSYLLFLFKWGGKDRLWLLPLVFCLWSNLHGGYFLGFVLIGMFIVGEIANHLLGYPDLPTLPRKSIIYLFFWTMVSLLTVLINPNGIETWLIPFKTVEVTTVQVVISEWTSPDFHDPTQVPFMIVLLLFLPVFALSEKRKDATEVFIVVAFSAMALIARRSFGPFALVTAPILGRHLWVLIQEWIQRIELASLWVSPFRKDERPSMQYHRLTQLINISLVALLEVVAIGKIYVTTYPVFVNGQLQNAYPVDAVAWLKSQPVEPELFNEYDWGGYLIWTLREHKVFVDGRTDLFAGDVLDQWTTVIYAQDGWQKILDQWYIRRVLVYPDRPIVRVLGEAGWKILYHDTKAVVLGRD